MKLRYNIIFLAVASVIVSCVQVNEDALNGGQDQNKVSMSLTATIESDVQTKTALQGSLSDAVMRTVWTPSDNIGVVAVHSSMKVSEPVNEFVTQINSSSETANFYGSAVLTTDYYAFYPYGEILRASYNKFVFNLPQEQKYAAGSFDPKAAPMVAKAPYGEVFDFQNLCGLLALQLKGTESVKSITFMAEDASGALMTVAGTYSVDMTYEQEPVITSTQAQTSITLLCDTPVQLGQQATPFYFILPPAEYPKFRIFIETADGRVMVKEGTKSLSIARAHVKPTAALQYAENVYMDLSEDGWANCYIVSKSGSYTFDATVIGNGELGLIEGAELHTTDVKIAPVSAELLWEDRANMIFSVDLVDDKVRFYASGKEGNALIAVKDTDGNILWSWHIWCTDVPTDHTYVNSRGTFVVHDRNLGAIRADRGIGDEWKESVGTYYQWGRKDPFVYGYFTYKGGALGIQETIASPVIYNSSSDYQWHSGSNTNLWSRDQKTIYDPCPNGYRISSKDIWCDFTKTGANTSNKDEMNVVGDYDNGWNFIYDGQNTAWYPLSGMINNNGYYYNSSYSYIGSADARAGLSYHGTSVEFSTTLNEVYGLNVRCVKEDKSSAVLVLLEGMSDITSTSAKVSGYVYASGKKEIDRRGFVYGTSEEPTLANSTVKECGNGQGTFAADLAGLNNSTKYHIRTFATVGGETIYSQVKTFTTKNASGVTDLSSEGTANCYIISQAGTYKFNASVKGNSTETISAEAVEVVWETLNTSDAVTQGAVIASVALENGYVKFTTPADFTPGNALIAVKSAGKILWSWHIWAVDADMEHNAQLYPNGALLMDRNLGALTIIPGDVRSFGLFYQWGRKDPFVGCASVTEKTYAATYPADAIQFMDSNSNYNNYNYAEAHPNHYIKGSGWSNDDKYWGVHKTMYDPCPYGWRVPDVDTDVWGGITYISYVNNGSFFNLPASDRPAYYPYTGYLYYSSGALSDINASTQIWTSTRERSLRTNSSRVEREVTYNVSSGNSVRCMKDAEFTITTAAKEDINLGSVNLGVPGTLTIEDGTVMDVIGVVYSETDSTPKLGETSCLAVDADTVAAGEFAVTVPGLKPKTRYYVRTYARGGYNLRYGDVREVWTNAAADNEGYGSEDFEW